jgi:hypothetical protein
MNFLLGLSVSILSMMGMAHVAVSTEDKDGERKTFDLEVGDESPQETAKKVERFGQTCAEAAQADLKAEKDALQEEIDSMQDLVVSEIIRRKKLAGKVGDDADLSVEDEREYLEGLPADRLQKEWERAPDGADLSGSTETHTTSDEPEDSSTDLNAAVSDLEA